VPRRTGDEGSERVTAAIADADVEAVVVEKRRKLDVCGVDVERRVALSAMLALRQTGEDSVNSL
jgi:hypothetical protein